MLAPRLPGTDKPSSKVTPTQEISFSVTPIPTQDVREGVYYQREAEANAQMNF